MSRTLAPLFAIAILFAASAVEAQFARNVERGSYSVAASERGFVLVDQQTGRTWILEASAEPEAGPVWVPLERIDEHQEGENWRSRKLAITQEQRQNAEHAERERAERWDPDRRRQHREHVEREHSGDHRPPERGERDGRPPEFRREADERIRHDLQELIERTERSVDLLREHVNEDHPSIRTRSEMLERLREQLEHAERDRRGQADGERDRQREQAEQRRSEFRRRADAAQSLGRRSFLESLQRHRDQLSDRVGDDHPTVKSLNRQIDRLEDEADGDEADGDEADGDDDDDDRERRNRDDRGERTRDREHEEDDAAAHRERDESHHVHAAPHDAGEHEDHKARLHQRREELERRERKEKREQDSDKADRVRPSADGEQHNNQTSRLRQLILQEKILLQSHGTEHPKVRSLHRQIEALRSLASDEDVQQELEKRDREQQRMAEQQARVRALRAAIEAKQAEIKQRLGEIEKKHGAESPEAQAGREVLELIQNALNDLEGKRQ